MATNRRGWLVVALALCVGALALPPGALAASIATDFGEVGVDCSGNANKCRYFGYITSPNDKCLANRKVKLFRLLIDGSTELVDVARTSKHGGFGGVGKSSEISAAKFKVLSQEGWPRHLQEKGVDWSLS